jgi:hypothetical protein
MFIEGVSLSSDARSFNETKFCLGLTILKYTNYTLNQTNNPINTKICFPIEL